MDIDIQKLDLGRIIQLNIKDLTEGKKVIDEMYTIKLEIERLGKIYEELQSQKTKIGWENITSGKSLETPTLDILDKTSSPLTKIYDAQSMIEQYTSVLQLMYITLDKLLFIQPKPLSFDPLRYRLWCKSD